jgi:hypothetical protein
MLLPLPVSRHQLIILASIMAITGIVSSFARGSASAELGTEGYSTDDFCGKLARFEMVMTSGFEHQQDINLPATVYTEIKCPTIQSIGPQALIDIRLEANVPWVDVEGQFVFDGTYVGEGHGTVAGAPNTRVVLDILISTDYDVSGTYTMGADGELGDPAVYAVGGEFGTTTGPTATPQGQTPKPAPTGTPASEPVVWGDNNCSGEADPIDSLLTLRHDAGLSANTGDCPAMGAGVTLVIASSLIWGDADCNGSADPIDSLKLLRFDAGLSVTQEEGCPSIGTNVELSP